MAGHPKIYLYYICIIPGEIDRGNNDITEINDVIDATDVMQVDNEFTNSTSADEFLIIMIKLVNESN